MGGDGMGWALDSDLLQIRRALEGIVEFTDLEHCEVVHSVWWEPLIDIPVSKLVSKRVICHLSGEPFRYLTLPLFHKAIARVGRWIAQSSEAQSQFESIGIQTAMIPYTTDTNVFHPIDKDDPDIQALRRKWLIPPDCYLIGNFHRDTEGHDLISPKLVKGPDIFVEIVAEIRRRGLPVHVLLAGPRRMWMRRELAKKEIPFTYVGQPTVGDDIESNLQSQEDLNKLYNLLDLYLVSSRSEGGPRTLLEALAAGCPVLSTRVGMAEDILPAECLYSTCCEAADLIEGDWRNRGLRLTLIRVREHLSLHHMVPAVRPLFADLYDTAQQILPFSDPVETISQPCHPSGINLIKTFFPCSLKYLLIAHKSFTVGLWHKFFKPPYGGGNQFMLALRTSLKKSGVSIRENRLSKDIDAYLLNSVHFDVEQFLDFSSKHKVSVLHRIDGPIHLIRGRDREKDDLCFQLNKRFASATVVQSRWTLQRIQEMGYQPVNPVIIHNSVDPEIFHRHGRIDFDPCRKIRLISSSWSDNVRKGGPIYKWIDKNLDWDRFDYTFVGNAAEPFSRIRQVAPVPSDELAALLRQHDIYITASSNDPCSNAVIEALACGLPVLYLDDGGHPELVGYGGLPFKAEDEILSQLDKLVDNYEMFQNLIVVPTMEEVAAKYLQLFKEIAGHV
jgi:glycosyltransferase involved in cell wall biosynthesis